MWLNDIIKEPEAFYLSTLPTSVYQCCLSSLLQDSCSNSRYHMLAQPCPLNFYRAKLFHKALRSHPLVKFLWPGFNYMLMTYHKEGWESEYLYFSLYIGRLAIIAIRQRCSQTKNKSACHSIEIWNSMKSGCKYFEWQILEKLTESWVMNSIQH